MAEGNCFHLSMYFKTAIFKIRYILPIISLFWSKNHTLFQKKIDRKDKLTGNSHNLAPIPNRSHILPSIWSENPHWRNTQCLMPLSTQIVKIYETNHDGPRALWFLDGGVPFAWFPTSTLGFWKAEYLGCSSSGSRASANKTTCIPGKEDKWK